MSARRKALFLAVSFATLVAMAPLAQAAATSGKDLLLQADEATYDSRSHVVSAHGHVEIDYDNRILLADSVSYNKDTDKVTADGHVSLTDRNGNVAFANHVVLTDRMRDGVLTGFGALIGKQGRLVAASAQRTEGRFTVAQHVAYTPCKICNKPGHRTPSWEVRAVRVTHDEETHKINFKDATIAIFGVPVAYTPFLTEPDPTVHHASGLLMPDPGTSTTIGYFIRIPYYWSISPSQDATIEPLITTRGGDVLLGEYRQRWNHGGMWLQGSLAQNPEGGLKNDHQQYYAHLFGSGRDEISPVWQFGYDVQVTSNDTYLKRYDISQLDRLMSDLFLVGQQDRSRFSMTGYFFQGLRATDNNKTFPIALPLIEYTYIPKHKWWGGQFSLDMNTVALSRDVGTNDQRFTTEMRWRMPLVANDGELWTLQLDARGDIYHTDTPAPLPSSGHYAYRGLPYAALDWRWPFIAYNTSGKAIILEPIAQIIVAPYGGNPKNIPNEDSQNVEIDDNNIFSFAQVPGYDLVQTGPRANIGLRAETRFYSGYLEALIGQTYRLKADPVFDPSTGLAATGLSGTHSDIVSRFSIKFPPYINLTNRLDIDEGTGSIRRDEVYVTGSYGGSSTRISYIQLAPTLGLPAREEVSAQMDVNFYRNWHGFAAIRRDLISSQTLEDEFGLGYDDGCLGISITYRRKYTADRDLPPSTTIMPEIRLKTSDIVPLSNLFPEDVFNYGRP